MFRNYFTKLMISILMGIECNIIILGYMITSDGKCITEIKKRIATAKDAFQKLSLILKNRNISMTTKFRV